MIDDMVNWGNFVKFEGAQVGNLLFESSLHHRLFSILLNDFLSPVVGDGKSHPPLGLKRIPHSVNVIDRTFLVHLSDVCSEPKFGADTTNLREAVDEFSGWLRGSFVKEDVHLCSIDIVADLKVTRIEYLKMCGDISKHHLGRLSRNVGKLDRLLKTAGYDVSLDAAYLAVEPFYECFFDDVFVYHSSQIAEYLNNICWAIFEYLEEEFLRSHHFRDDLPHPAYSFSVPASLSDPIAKGMYWELMNKCRRKPIVHRFEIIDLMKARY